jgi:hypothetical protein
MKLLFVLLVLTLLGVSVTACGGASKGTGSASQTSSSATATGGAPTTTTFTGTTPAPTTATGVGSENAGGTDKIATFGHAASVADKQAITALVKRYYAAAVADDGAKACTLIYSLYEEAIAEDYGRSPPGPPGLSGNTCAVVMTKLFKHVPGQPPAVLATTEVTGVRVKGKDGIVQLHSKAIPRGEIAVRRELGSWKVLAMIGKKACTNCTAG